MKKIFGFSSNDLRVHLSFKSFPSVPLQILDALLQPRWNILDNKQTKAPESHQNVEYHHTTSHSTSTYLPNIQRYLPNDWCAHHTNSMGATKSDDANVQVSLWDKRITSIYPTFTPKMLQSLRGALLAYSCKKLLKEFFGFLDHKYG